MFRITLVTDAWAPQINGAVTTLSNTVSTMRLMGHSVTLVEPSQFKTVPCPTYPEIPLALASARQMANIIEGSRPDFVLIAVEGPLGFAARQGLTREGIPYSSSCLTRFHDYLWHRFGLPKAWGERWLDWFHRPAECILTPSASMKREFHSRGLTQTRTWRPGVDREIFRPRTGQASALLDGLPRPILLYVGRFAVEKNIDAFFKVDARGGSKVLIGDGPIRSRLEAAHPAARFLGYRSQREIAEICSAADVLVFPSLTDTFGHVIVEALSCGLPVAAYPVQGPSDIFAPDPTVGAMHADLDVAVDLALEADRDACVAFAATYSWENSTAGLLSQLAPAGATIPLPARLAKAIPEHAVSRSARDGHRNVQKL